MPQEFQVLRCYKCQTFQVHQVKKSTKYNCKLCGEKQSIKKVFGRGSGADCRQHVQKCNMAVGEMKSAAATSISTVSHVEGENFENSTCEETQGDGYLRGGTAFTTAEVACDGYMNCEKEEGEIDYSHFGPSQQHQGIVRKRRHFNTVKPYERQCYENAEEFKRTCLMYPHQHEQNMSNADNEHERSTSNNLPFTQSKVDSPNFEADVCTLSQVEQLNVTGFLGQTVGNNTSNNVPITPKGSELDSLRNKKSINEGKNVRRILSTVAKCQTGNGNSSGWSSDSKQPVFTIDDDIDDIIN